MRKTGRERKTIWDKTQFCFGECDADQFVNPISDQTSNTNDKTLNYYVKSKCHLNNNNNFIGCASECLQSSV